MDDLYQKTSIMQRKQATFGHQQLDALVLAPFGFGQPGEVIPDQQICNELVVVIRQRFGVFNNGARHACKHFVFVETIDQAVFIGAQAIFQQSQAFLRIFGDHRIRQRAQQRVAQAGTMLQIARQLAGVILDLLQQHRGEIDHRARLRFVFDMRHHVDIILDRMQISPRQAVFTTA